jgi:hypothetical protein
MTCVLADLIPESLHLTRSGAQALGCYLACLHLMDVIEKKKKKKKRINRFI